MIPKLEHIHWLDLCKKELKLNRAYSLVFVNFIDNEKYIQVGETTIDNCEDDYDIISLNYKYFNDFIFIKKTILHELIHKKQGRWGYFIANINDNLLEKQTLEWEKLLYRRINKIWIKQEKERNGK